MGLDNGFCIKRKNEEGYGLEIFHVQNFNTLDKWIRWECKSIKDEDAGIALYNVTWENLKSLKEDLLPIAQVLIQIPGRLLGKYDDHGYPKKYKLEGDELIHEEFNPITSGSSYAGIKTLKLYHAVCTMMDFLVDHEYDTEPYQIIFYSSY